MIELEVQTPEQMELLGETIGTQLRAGDVLGLNGELGAGKTTLVRGIGRALKVEGGISSPTFILARTHRTATAPLVHVDAYRLSSPAELDDLDIDFKDSIVVIEWSVGMVENLVDSWLEINIERDQEPQVDEAAPDTRRVRIFGHGERFTDFRL